MRRFLLETVFGWLLEKFVWSYAALWGPTVMAAVAGYIGDRPWDLIILIAVGTFAGCATGLYFLTQWRADRTPENKLRPGATMLGKMMNKDATAFPAVIAIKLGFTLNSVAKFPLEFEVVEIRTRIANRINATPSYKNRMIRVEMEGSAFYLDDAIDLVGAIRATENLEGQLFVKIRYGRPGDRKYELTRAWNHTIAFDEKGDVKAHEATDADPTASPQ